jgi:PhnB protein
MAKKKVKPIPKGYGAVQPALNLTDASGAMEFVKLVFGAKIIERMAGDDGKLMHGAVKVGDSVVMFSDAMNEPVRAGNLIVYVPNVDKTFAKAVKAGAKTISEPTDQFWGDRFCRFEDPFGNRWGVATHIENVSPKQMKKRMAQLGQK